MASCMHTFRFQRSHVQRLAKYSIVISSHELVRFEIGINYKRRQEPGVYIHVLLPSDVQIVA